MKNDIIAKLNEHIRDGINREADVVYLFVQIGKILEQEDARAYPTLQFYRNWVVHHRLDRIGSNPGMKTILDKLEAAAQAHYENRDKNEILELISGTVSLRRLWEEMESFFNSHDEFDHGVLNTPEPWANIGGLILRILVDLPLIAPNSYRFIREFRFSPPADDTHVVRVQISLGTGELLESPVSLT